MPKLSDWNYDYPSLPHWNLRNEVPYVYDLLHESPTQDAAVLIYSIVEWRMLDYAGYLAILRNKKKPELALLAKNPVFRNDEIVFSEDGALAFVNSAIWDGRGFPVFIFDLSAGNFSFFRIIHQNAHCTVKEIGRNEFVVEHDAPEKFHGEKIPIDALKWMPWADLDPVCEQLRKTSRLPGFFKKIGRFIASRFT